MRIGFAGLGRMGTHMARNLIAAGHEVFVWNRTETTARDFASSEGCVPVQTPADFMARAGIVVTMLADDAVSYQMHLGKDELFAVAGPRQ